MGLPDRANHSISDSIAVASEARSPLVQRACACGNVAKLANSCGTCEVSQRFGAPALQRKVALGAPDDRFEQEADRVAEQVVGMAAPDGTEEAGPRDPAPADEETLQAKPLQAKSQGGALEAASAAEAATAVASGGRPLSGPERAFFEPRFGRDFSSVRVHEHRRAAVAAGGIKARAFTLGRDIGFAAGAYQPGSEAGRRLMAHELTHTIQQTGLPPAHLARVSVPRVQRAAAQRIQRAPPETDEDLLDRYMTDIEDGHASKVKQSGLAMLGNYELEKLKDFAKDKRERLHRQADTASNPRSKETFENEARNVFFVIDSILNIQILRGRVTQSTEFKEIADKVRGELSGDQLCVYEQVLPLIPKFLEGLLEGRKVTPSQSDRAFGGYVSAAAARGLVSGPVTNDKVLEEMTVLPRLLAEAFHRAGHETDLIVKEMRRQFRNINEGMRIILFQKNQLGSGASHSEPAVQLAHKVEGLVSVSGTLYSCLPQEGGTFWSDMFGGQSDEDKERQKAEREAATAGAEESLGELPDELVPKHEVKVLGLEPKE